MATARHLYCLAVSKGGIGSELITWDAKTFKQVFSHKENDHGVNFSPDPTRLVTAPYSTATVWKLATRKKVQTLGHEDAVIAAKY